MPISNRPLFKSTLISAKGLGIGASPFAKTLDSNISAITTSVVSIANILKNQQKIATATSDYERKKAEQEKRAASESKLEKRFDGLRRAAEKIIAPVKNALSRILDFFVKIFFGRVIFKLIEWMGDPKNASKLNSVIRFLKDFGPTLLSLYILFGTSFGKFTRGLVSLLVKGGARLLAAAAGLGSRLGIRGLGRVAGFVGGPRGKLLAAGIEAAVTVGGTLALDKALRGDEQQKTPGFAGGGFPSKFKNFFSGFGQVRGKRGKDQIPAMLSHGEFVMAPGAVQMYGVDTLEAMNAAGGGTNKPQIIGGTAYAAGGGLIGANPDPAYKDPILSERLNLMKSLEKYSNLQISRGGDRNLIGALNNLSGVLSGQVSAPKSGGGVTGSLMRMLSKSPTSVRGGGGAGGFAAARGYLGRVGNEIKKKTNIKMPEINLGNMTKDVSGIQNTVSNAVGAAQEAIPALVGGILGINRTDTNISEDMQRQLLKARATAGKAGRDYVDYKDYEGGGLSSAALTMGRIGNKDWKRDSKGRIIGLRQVYDTNRSAEEAMKQSGDSLKDFIKTGNIQSLGRAIYKPGEALLASVQNRGVTTHDINFSEKVLGFKSEAVKNQEALEAKRPWWDKMGMFGGASAEIKRRQQKQAESFARSGGAGRYSPPASQKRLPVKPPVRSTTYMQGQTAVTMYGANDPRRKKSTKGTTVPKFSATTSGMRSKQETLGMMR